MHDDADLSVGGDGPVRSEGVPSEPTQAPAGEAADPLEQDFAADLARVRVLELEETEMALMFWPL